MGIKNKKNPFFSSFLSVVIVCCTLLSIACFLGSYVNEKRLQQKYATESAERIMEDWEIQLQQMKNVASRIVSDHSFHPYVFKKDINKARNMLKEFPRYEDYSVLIDEFFLEYGEERIYRSVGSSLEFEMYLNMMSESEEERRLFREEIEAVKVELSDVCGIPKAITAFDKLYILIPIKMYSEDKTTNAVLSFVVSISTLQGRFQIVEPYMEGELALYGEGEILYSDSETPCRVGENGVITVTSVDEVYTVCYRPEMTNKMSSDLFLLLLLLITIDLTLIFGLSNIYAKKAYAPVKVMAEKYRKMASKLDVYHENAMEEIQYILDDILEKNTTANAQIQRYQKEVRNQLLKMALDSRTFSEMYPRMEKAGIYLPGSFYCVAGIYFMNWEEVPEDFLERLQEEIELIPENKEEEYIYAIFDNQEKVINIIISAPTEKSEDILLETICDVAVSFSYEPIIGIGNTYSDIKELPVSYLESMDDIQYKVRNATGREYKDFIYENDNLRKISTALESGNERLTLERLEGFVQTLGDGPISALMMQYIIADFLGEIQKLGAKYNIGVSKGSVSLLVSARKVADFRSAAEKIIHEFCEKQDSLRGQMKDEESLKILEYIQGNFMQYDVSIDGIAEKMQTSTDNVRQAVQKHTGKLYRDYLIYLRIEYAKELLLKEDTAVAAICQKVGYGNVSYFIKLFREVVGQTPAQYRKSFGILREYEK